MKQLIAALAIAACSFTAQASMVDVNIQQVSHFDFSKVKMDKNSPLGNQNVIGAELSMNEFKHTMHLTINSRFACPPGRFCTMNKMEFLAIPAPTIIDVPLLYIGSPFCGGLVAMGEEDKTPVDGMHTRITLTESNDSLCKGQPIKKLNVTLVLEQEGPRDAGQNVPPQVSVMYGVRHADLKF
jgi:hypothetical protein